MTIRIAGIGTALPAHAFDQQALYRDCLVPYFGQNPRAAKIFEHPAIATRHSVLSDPAAFFAARPGTGERNRVFAEQAPLLAQASAEACLATAGLPATDLDALVGITCTGYMTPGLDILLAQRLGMRADLRRFLLGGIGCYAAFPGLNLARQAVASGAATRAMAVSVELCTLHFQDSPETDNVVSTSLFADGSSAILLEAGPGAGWEVVDTRTRTVYGTGDHMTWNLGDTGFTMHLSSYVPLILKEAVGGWLADWLSEHGLTTSQVPRWGIHPGGPRILDGLQAVFELSDEQMSASRAVLRECGNMSSATIYFILERMTAENPRHGEHAVIMAFGPGLTMEGALLRWRDA